MKVLSSRVSSSTFKKVPSEHADSPWYASRPYDVKSQLGVRRRFDGRFGADETIAGSGLGAEAILGRPVSADRPSGVYDSYDVSPDGQRFVMLESAEEQARSQPFVQNWFAEFRGRQTK